MIKTFNPSQKILDKTRDVIEIVGNTTDRKSPVSNL